MSEITDLRDRLALMIRRCEEIVMATEQQGPQLVRDNVARNVDSFTLPVESQEHLVTAMSAILQKVVAQTRRVLVLQKSMADGLGDPDRLREAARSINERVTGASTSLAERVHRSALTAVDNDDAWNGPGAEGYARVLDGRADAVRQVAEVTAEVEELLDQFADNLEKYYATLLTTVGRLYGALLGIAGAVATGPTGVGPLRGIATSVASLVDLLIEHVQDLVEKNAVIEKRLRELGENTMDWPNR